MKILGGIEPVKTETKKSTTAKTVNFTERLKKQKRAKRLLKFMLLLIAASVVAYIWANAAQIFEPLRGIASKIETKTSNEVGFPVKLPGSASYSFERFGENFSLLTDTYLYAYETDGAQIYALRHGYSNPAQSTSSRRILIYDKSAYYFAVYNKTSLIFQNKTEDKIVYGTISDNDLTAIVTTSVRYSNIIYVYDGSGNWKYTRKLADENVMQVSFSDNEHIIVTTIGVNSGEIVTSCYRFSIRSGEGYDWKYSFKSNSLPCGLYADNEKSVMVCDNRVLMLNTRDGSVTAEYEFNGSLRDYAVTADKTAIYYNDVSKNRNVVDVLDAKLQQDYSFSVTSPKQLLIDNGAIYVLDGRKLKIYGSDYGQQTVPLPEDYTDFIKIDGGVYLLGYDVVAEERIE